MYPMLRAYRFLFRVRVQRHLWEGRQCRRVCAGRDITRIGLCAIRVVGLLGRASRAVDSLTGASPVQIRVFRCGHCVARSTETRKQAWRRDVRPGATCHGRRETGRTPRTWRSALTTLIHKPYIFVTQPHFCCCNTAPFFFCNTGVVVCVKRLLYFFLFVCLSHLGQSLFFCPRRATPHDRMVYIYT